MAASKEAVKAAKAAGKEIKVACFDYVKPTEHGTKWGLGGTCVNVGCIPKKLFHTSGIMKHNFKYANALGWDIKEQKHDWGAMTTMVDNYIKMLNRGYKKALRSGSVEYINAMARFVDKHTVEYELNGEWKQVTSDKFIIAVGGRPVFPDNTPGAKEFGISSDDIFWWKKNPGKTLCVGGAYISLECASFLHEQGYDVTVAVRSILLRGFDRQCSEQIGEVMERQGIRFLNPVVVKKMEKPDPEGKITVTLINRNTQEEIVEEYDTVLFAIGRYALTDQLNVDKIGLEMKKGKILVDDQEQTNVDNVFAIGDVVYGNMELTPLAIQAGQLLARRLFASATRKMNYKMCPTTVFTMIEYGMIGLSQEEAEEALGKENVEVYVSRYGTLETAVKHYEMEIPKQRSYVFTKENLFARKHALEHKSEWNECLDAADWSYENRSRGYMDQPNLAKVICDKTKDNKVRVLMCVPFICVPMKRTLVGVGEVGSLMDAAIECVLVLAHG